MRTFHSTPARHTGATGRAPWAWAWGGVCIGVVLATLLFAPARWLAAAVAHATSDRVQLRQTQGTVWDGSAQLVLGGGEGTVESSALPGSLQWRLRPHWNGMNLQLSAPCCLDASWGWQLRLERDRLQVLADDLAPQASHWPAQLLSGLGTPWNTMLLRGTLAFHTQDFQLSLGGDSWALQGTAAVDAVGVSTALSTLQPLGSYRLQLHGGAQPQMELSTLSGKLLLSGQGQLAQGRWRFTGEARSDEASQGALGNLLNIIGRREGARSVITVG